MATTFKVGDAVEVRHDGKLTTSTGKLLSGVGRTTVTKVSGTTASIGPGNGRKDGWEFDSYSGMSLAGTAFTIHPVIVNPVTHTTDADGDKWTVEDTGRFVRVNSHGQFTVKVGNTVKRYTTLKEALAIASQGDWTLVREGNSPSGLPMKLLAGPQGFRLESDARYVEAATLEDLLFTPQVSK